MMIRRSLLLVKGLGFSLGMFPRKTGEAISAPTCSFTCHRGKVGGFMEPSLGALCPGSYVKEAGKYGWPALATLVWAHRFCSRNIAMVNWERASGQTL